MLEMKGVAVTSGSESFSLGLKNRREQYCKRGRVHS